MTVTRTFYSGVELLAFKVIATSFRSDPDIYISTDSTQIYPTNYSNSLTYCEQKGSDTCILQSGQFSVGQTIYIGIKCDTACSYSLTTWYAAIASLPQSIFRSQYRFAANSTQILQYVIPPKVSNSPTNSIEILIEPEKDYSFLEVFVNFDQSFYVQQQQASTLITKTGNAIKINSADYQWCTSCTIYLILNVQINQRYYISATPRGPNDNLQITLPTNVLVSPFTQECYSYFVSGATNDLRFDVEGFTGQSDLYITAGSPATSPNDTSILIRAAQGPQRGVVLSYFDRNNFGQPSGSYFICFYAYTPFSGQITTTETIFTYGLETIQNQIRTSIIKGQQFIYSRFTNSYLNQNGTINIYVEAQGLSIGQLPPTVYYKICNSSNYDSCSVNQTDIQNMNSFGLSTMNSLYSSQATINHNSALCPSTNGQCTYLFAYFNTLSTQKVVSARINYQYNTPGTVSLNQRYVNKISQGNYFNYMILPSQNMQMHYFKSLKIKLYSLRGDGDLFVSLDAQNPTYDNAIFQCRLNDDYEEITLNLENGWPQIFSQNIYFSIFANTYTQIQIDFESVLLPVYDQNTDSAQPLSDKQSIYEILKDENQQRAYSYSPWWSGKENRTIIFFADIVVNQILVYTSLNKYPQHFLTSYSDTNDSIAIYGSNSQYYSFNGTYYLELLPNFQLSGLISQLQYIYTMHAFSMTPAARQNEQALAYETMDLDYSYDGFANQSLYQDYRYFQIDMTAVYNISLIRYSGQGLPIFFVSVIDSNQGQAPRFTSYQFKSQLSPGYTTRQNLTLTPTNRTSRNPRCGTVFQSLQGDGSSACFIAISVTCNSTQQCVYQLKISQIGVDTTVLKYSQNSQTILPLVPPMPILTRDYVNGNVNGSGVIKYYYLPINYQTVGHALILLVKYQYQFTNQNGDSKLMVNIQNNTLDPVSGYNYKNWVYPTDQQQGRQSATGNYQQVEIVDVCLKSLNETCFGAKGCGIIAGVVGMSYTPSNYRIKAFYSQNKLKVNNPIYVNKQILGSSSFDYYWFVITEGINNQYAMFDYYVTVNSNTTGDKDLYVSLMDGREPNEYDYDLTSNQQGADMIRIAWNSTIWDENNWNITSGVVVVVGVKLYQQTNYTIVLANAPDQNSPFLQIQRFNIGQSVQISLPDISSNYQQRNYTLMYMLYNWQQYDFAFTLTMNQGNSTLQYGVTGQLDQSNNLFSAIPFNQNNSIQFYDVTQGNYQSVQVQGSSCYNCWYFIRIDINSPYVMQFQVTASASNSIQGQYLEIFNGQPQQLYMNAGQTQQIKFILDSKDGWQLQGVIANGQVNVYIGLDPTSVGPSNYIWKASGQAGQSAIISVKQIDPNFYFGTYYFVSIIASQNSNAVATFTLVQTRTVMFIGNNHDYSYLINPANSFGMLPTKVTLYTKRELVKFHVFNVPGVSSGQAVYHQVTITITILDQNIFPVLYLNKVEMSSQPQYVNMLTFPNINSYQLVFGENPFYQLNAQEISYSFYGVALQQWTQYTMAVYVYNWGMTNQKKNEYEIDVQVSIVSECTAIQCDSNGNPIVQSTKPVVQATQKNGKGIIQSLVSQSQKEEIIQSKLQIIQ